jgi:hypothetical protein
LVSVQDQIARAVNIPVMVSALSLFPVVRAAHGGRRIGIITASRPNLGQTAMAAAGIAGDTALVAGMEDCTAFADAILVPKVRQTGKIDRNTIEAAVVAKAVGLCEAEPTLGAILLECGNLPPYATAIRATTERPVYSILDVARLLAP